MYGGFKHDFALLAMLPCRTKPLLDKFDSDATAVQLNLIQILLKISPEITFQWPDIEALFQLLALLPCRTSII